MKTTLIIDGNYLLNKDVFVLFNLKTLHQDLYNLLMMDIEKLMKMYPFDKVYFISDSKAGYWRRQIYSDYKLGRVYDEKIDWDWVYSEYNNVVEELSQNPKIEMYKIDLAEGDDIMAYIINRNNELGYSNLLINSDSDLYQLLRFDLSKDYINFSYNYKFSDEKIYFPENYNIFLTEKKRSASNTLFSMNDDDEFIEFIEELINKTKTIEVSNEQVLFVKLISGDKSDNISSVYEKTGKTGKSMGIGKSGAESIYKLYKETYNENIDFDSDEFVEKASEVTMYSKKIDISEVDDIKAKIRRNRKLIKLTENYLPNYLLKTLNEKIEIN